MASYCMFCNKVIEHKEGAPIHVDTLSHRINFKLATDPTAAMFLGVAIIGGGLAVVFAVKWWLGMPL